MEERAKDPITRLMRSVQPSQSRLIGIAATMVFSTAVLTGCNGSSPTGPSDPFVDTQSFLIGGLSAPRFGYQAPRSGRMTLEVSWGNPDVNIDLYMTPSCPELTNCGILERSTATTGTRERVSRSVIEGEHLTFFVDNRSAMNEAIAVRFAIE